MRSDWFLTSKSLLLSVLLHLVLGSIALFSFAMTIKKAVPPPQANINIVDAVSVDKKQVDLELKRLKEKEEAKKAKELQQKRELEALKKQRAAEEQRLKQLKQQKDVAEKKRQQEEARLKKIEQQKREQEKQRKLEEKKRKEAERRRKEAEKREAERKKQEAERRKKEEAARKKREADRKRKEQEEQLQAEMEAELKAKQDKRDVSEIGRFLENKIIPAIESKFNTTSLPKGLSCDIRFKVQANGDVYDVVVIKSSDAQLFDRRAEVAIRQASPLPMPTEPRLINKMVSKSITITFEPKY